MNPASRIVALATDYDETLAAEGSMAGPTVAALERLQASGRKLILVTGRELEDLLRVCPEIALFDCVVAENGAVLYLPGSQTTRSLASSPPARLLQMLRQRAVRPLSVGHSIVATVHDQYEIVRATIRELRLAEEIIFNRDALMILPAGISKGTGLEAALGELCLPPEGVVGIGDAENDEPFLKLCEISVAVNNALPSIKETANIVTNGDRGDGVIEIIDAILDGRIEALSGRETFQQE
ncbi:MAG TPA: HAD family hydrolase [Candidatus Angelobacter sp.]|nr:HAD family hydrolase [Candidatus Angelobacter sp.]